MTLIPVSTVQAKSGTRYPVSVEFDYIQVQFLTFANVSYFDGYKTIAPIFIQPVVDIKGVNVAYDRTYRVNKNPSIIDTRDIPFPVKALDVSGAYSSIITLYKDDGINEGNLPRYITKRFGFLPMDIHTSISLSDVPFDNFLITGLLLNEEPNINTNIDVRILLNGDLYNNFSITYKDHAIPEIPMTPDFSLAARPTRDATGVVIGIREVNVVAILE